MKAVPFHATIRIRLGSGSPIKDNDGNVIGIGVSASIKKNKVAPPHRSCTYQIIFGKGIIEHEDIFDTIRAYCDKKGPIPFGDSHKVLLGGGGAWKCLTVTDNDGVVVTEKKFHKSDFDEIMKDPTYKPFCDVLFDSAYIINEDSPEPAKELEEEVDPKESFDAQ